MTRNNIALPGLVNRGSLVTQGSASLHPGLRVHRRSATLDFGIDITHLAIALIEKRLRDAFPKIEFSVEGTPKDLDGARKLAELDKYEFQYWACTLVNAQPAQNKKKGADKGIDGLIFIHDTYDSPSYGAKRNRRGLGGGPAGVAESLGIPDATTPQPPPPAGGGGVKKVLVNVKGGENVSVTMIRDFAHVIDREKAAIGLFVTLAEPTRPMREEAAALGFYDEARFGTKFPKLQILTIEGLMSGTDRAEYPDLSLGQGTFKKAMVEDVSGEQERMF